jgi:hypothetical protein
MGFTRYDMKPVGAQQRLGALAVAISVTFLIVWSMGSLGYPDPAGASPTAVIVASAAACKGAL